MKPNRRWHTQCNRLEREIPLRKKANSRTTACDDFPTVGSALVDCFLTLKDPNPLGKITFSLPEIMILVLRQCARPSDAGDFV